MLKTDHVIEEITDYVLEKEITSSEAYTTAGHVLLDTLGRGILALGIPNAQSRWPDCSRNDCAEWKQSTGNVICSRSCKGDV